MQTQKMCIFVEGQAEMLFVQRFIKEVAGNKNLKFTLGKNQGSNRKGTRRMIQISLHEDPSNELTIPQFLVQIISSEGDEQVLSDIREQYENLVSSGFSPILGIQDLYPTVLAELAKVRRAMLFSLRPAPKAKIILSIMEIEAWFLAEYTHFQKISPSITVTRISAELGFNPQTEDMKEREHPADDLHNIYQLAGLAYRKTEKQVQRTLNALDYAQIYCCHGEKFPDFQVLMNEINDFLSSPTVDPSLPQG